MHVGSKETSPQISSRLKKSRKEVIGYKRLIQKEISESGSSDIRTQYNLRSWIKEAAESRPSRELMQYQGGAVRSRERRRQESRPYNKEHRYKQQSTRQSRQEQEQEPRSGRSSRQSLRRSRGAKQQ
ncbi:hypothetical protein TNCV_2035871 [Trichonephila clavipes]|nr:hypothetical protein TNCV_2035871 [Trichonephila clavipes]